MSQDTHRLYKIMLKSKSEYYRFKLDGRGGIRQDYYDYMVVDYKYDYLKKLLEYLSLEKYENYNQIFLRQLSVPYNDIEKLSIQKLNSDKEIINLRRLVKLTKTKVLLKKQEVF